MDKSFQFVSRSDFRSGHRFLSLLVVGLALAGLVLISRYSFLLFHSLAEMASIAVAWAIFLLIRQTTKYSKNNALTALGTAYFFVGLLDLIHTLAYSGMGVFPDSGGNLATQLWIAARAQETVALLAFALMHRRPEKGAWVGWVYGAICACFLLSILVWDIFPVCFQAGEGLTGFKILCEYLMVGILTATMVLLHSQRSDFDLNFYRLVQGSIGITILSELAFTLYTDVYGVSNMMGHLLKILSVGLIYQALIVEGIRRPFGVLLREFDENKKALSQSEEYFRAIFNGSRDAILIADQTGLLLSSNSAALNLTGYRLEELRNLGLRNLCTNWESGREAPVEGDLCRKDGSLSPIEMSIQTIALRSGEIILAVIRDITERKRALISLQSSESRLRSLFACSPDMIFTVDRENRIQYINRTPEGLTPEQVLGTCSLDYIRAAHRELVRQKIQRVFATGEPDSYEVQAQGPHQSLSWYHTRLSAISPGGSIDQVLLVSRDITAEKELRERMHLAQFAMDQAFDGVYLTNPEGAIIYANRNYCAMMEYSESELTGRPIREISPGQFRDDWSRFWDRLRSMKTHTEHFAFRRKDASLLNLEATARYLQYRNIEYACFFVRDITSRERAEKALQASEAKYRALVEGSFQGVVMFQEHSLRISFINQAMANILDYPREDLPRLTFERLVASIYSDDRNSFRERIGSCIRGEVPFDNWTCRYIPPGGQTRWLEISLRRFDFQRSVAVMAVFMDVSERKSRELLIARRDAALVALNAMGGILLAHPGWRGADQALEKLGNAIQVRGAYIYENTFDEARRLSAFLKAKWWNSPESPVEGAVPRNFSYQDRTYHRWMGLLGKGEPVCGLVSHFPEEERAAIEARGAHSLALYPIFVENDWWGFIGFEDTVPNRFWSAVEMDLLAASANLFATAIVRTRQSEAVARSEVRYRQLFEDSNDAIVIHDVRGNVLEVNQRACDMAGYSREELSNMAIWDFHPPHIVSKAKSQFLQVQRIGNARFEMQLVRKDQTILDVEVSVRALGEGNRLFEGIIRDVTERKRLQRSLLQSTEDERRRLGEDMHDGICQDLKSLEVDATLLEDRLAVLNSQETDRARNLADNINQVTKKAYSVARGLMPLLEMVNLPSALELMAQQMETRYSIQVAVWHSGESLPDLPEGADYQLYRIAQEAVRNAVRHGGATRILVLLRHSGQAGYLKIRDNGKGIPPESGGRKGMGLHIMRFRAESLGATLEVLSAAGRGTQIICRWRSYRRGNKEDGKDANSISG